MLEDNHADILGKACSGLGISPGRFPGAFLDSPDEAGLRAAAGALGLAAGPLAAIACGEYLPDAGPVPDGLAMFATPFADMLVNSYVVWDGKSAAAFDTGTDCDGILDLVRVRGLRLESVFLTHSHGDHIYDLDRLLEKTGAKAWTGEAVAGAELFAPGREFSLGSWKISTRLTRGHSSCGITYVVEGPARRVAITGDALFAGSMGGGKVSYADALRTTRDEILSLPPDTLVCPGHGPMTTVGGERLHNPFFAAQPEV